MEASGSGLFNNFIGITTVDPSLYQNQTYQMDWSQVMSTSTPFQAEQVDISEKGLCVMCTKICLLINAQ